MKTIYYRKNGEKLTSCEFRSLTEARKHVSGDRAIVKSDEKVTVLQKQYPEPKEIESVAVGMIAISLDTLIDYALLLRTYCEEAGVFLEIRDI